MSRVPGPDDGPLPETGYVNNIQDLLITIARLEGQVKVLGEQLASLDAADEHHRADLQAARAEAAEAQAAVRVGEARVEAANRSVAELRERVRLAEEARGAAERERTAVIAALGWRARKRLKDRSESSGS